MDQHTSRPRKSESMPSITAHGFHWRLQGISKKLTRFLPCPLIQYSCSVKVFGLLFDSCVLKCMSMSNVTEIPMCFNVVSTVSSVHLLLLRPLEQQIGGNRAVWQNCVWPQCKRQLQKYLASLSEQACVFRGQIIMLQVGVAHVGPTFRQMARSRLY